MHPRYAFNIKTMTSIIRIRLLILLFLFKPAAQAQVGKTKLFISCFCNPTSSIKTVTSSDVKIQTSLPRHITKIA